MKSRVRQNQKISNIVPKIICLTHRADYSNFHFFEPQILVGAQGLAPQKRGLFICNLLYHVRLIAYKMTSIYPNMI